MNHEQHWGKWIARRAEFIGIVSMKRFAVEVGCSVDQLRNWRLMAVPPSHMRKGFDDRLAAILKTNRATLFRGFAVCAPESTPVIEPSSTGEFELSASRRRIAAVVELMPEDRLNDLARMGEQLLRDALQPA